MQNPKSLNEKQTQMLKDHLKLVLTKETPERNEIDDILSRTKVSPKNNGTGGEILYCNSTEYKHEYPHGKNGLIC